MAEMADAFEQVIEFEMWETVLATLAGFFAPTVLENLLGGVMPDAVDHSEVYGLGVVAGGQMLPKYSTEVSVGGGLATADAAAERFGVKSTIVEAGA